MRTILYLLVLIVCNCEKSIKVDVYPGFGWDHLRFLEMNPLYDVSNFNDSDVFQSCIEMIPIHENRIETGSTVVDTFSSKSTEYSSSLLIKGSAGFGRVGISGSYSNDYQTIKQEQGEQKTVTLRNHIDYLMVDVILQSSCPLHPQAKKDLMQIAEYIFTSRPSMATYAAQMFVKNYGTHFVSRLYLGGSISEEDFISQSTYYDSNFDKRTQKAAAEASFLGTFSISVGASYSWTQSQSVINQYKQNIQRKVIQSRGGDVFILGTPMKDWQSSVKTKPAIIQRGIENMTYIIQSDKIPELSELALAGVRQKVKEAIETYIEMNIVKGCINRDSPSFNWVANIDDGSCAPSTLLAQFGGFIQTCSEDSRMTSRCNDYRINNFYTSTDQCKSGFSKYTLHQYSQYESLYRRDCRKCGFLWLQTCCDDVYIGTGRRDLTIYGCNQNPSSSYGGSVLNLMHVYGGSYTSNKENPVTNAKTCPSSFAQAKAPGDITICLAERLSASMSSLPRYGGVYSCDYGNIATGTGSRSCSVGFSPFVMGSVGVNCLLYVCLKFEVFEKERSFPNIVLPPFFEPDLGNSTINSNETIANGAITSRMIDVPNMDVTLLVHTSNSDTIMLRLSVAILSYGMLLFPYLQRS